MRIPALVLALCVALAPPSNAAAARDGSHDFDYQFGVWNVSVSRLTNASKWATYVGTHSVTPLWSGRANIGVLEIHGSRDSIEGLQLRLYDPSTQTWALSFASSNDGELQKPSVGAFHDGVGDFRETETIGGKSVLVRSESVLISAASYRDVISRSYDGGKTWAPVWIATYTKQSGALSPSGTQHDFDFEFGSWTAHLKRLRHPLSGDTAWVTYDGTSIVHPLLHGRENVGELDVRGAAGPIEGLTIRTFDVANRRWNVSWVNAGDGTVTNPMTGGFHNGEGLFFGNDTLGGKPILVRFEFSNVTRRHFAFRQAFSGDGGKSWEVNWVATFDRTD